MSQWVISDSRSLELMNEEIRSGLGKGIREIKVQIDYGKNRSKSQNDLFHQWCGEFAAELTRRGREADKEEAKLWFKSKFLGFEDLRVGREVISQQLRSSSKLKSGEMYHFMEQVWQYSAETFGIYLTIPEDSVFMKNRKKQDGS